MNNKSLTYQKVALISKQRIILLKFISSLSKTGKSGSNFENIGGFGSISDIPKYIKNPKIVACTDGVGTKIEIANMLNKFNTIGIDLVAMSVNDLIVQGAKPILFLRLYIYKQNKFKKIKVNY